MKKIRTTLTEYKVIEHFAKQLQVATGQVIKFTKEFKSGGVMVTAPIDFLSQLGF